MPHWAAPPPLMWQSTAARRQAGEQAGERGVATPVWHDCKRSRFNMLARISQDRCCQPPDQLARTLNGHSPIRMQHWRRRPVVHAAHDTPPTTPAAAAALHSLGTAGLVSICAACLVWHGSGGGCCTSAGPSTHRPQRQPHQRESQFQQVSCASRSSTTPLWRCCILSFPACGSEPAWPRSRRAESSALERLLFLPALHPKATAQAGRLLLLLRPPPSPCQRTRAATLGGRVAGSSRMEQTVQVRAAAGWAAVSCTSPDQLLRYTACLLPSSTWRASGPLPAATSCTPLRCCRPPRRPLPCWCGITASPSTLDGTGRVRWQGSGRGSPQGMTGGACRSAQPALLVAHTFLAPGSSLAHSIHAPGRGRYRDLRWRYRGARHERGRPGAGAVVQRSGGLRAVIAAAACCRLEQMLWLRSALSKAAPTPTHSHQLGRWMSCWRWGAMQGQMWLRASPALPRPSSWLGTPWEA